MKSDLLWIPECVIDDIVIEADRWAPKETGGAFVGYETDNGVVITNVVHAGPNAVRSNTSFFPDAAYQLEKIAELYEGSARLHTYVGDWHTHPTSSPAYSTKDRAAMRVVADEPKSRCAAPVMLILGEGDPWTAVAWRYHPARRTKVEPMHIRRFG